MVAPFAQDPSVPTEDFMAKKSMLNREKKRERLVRKFAARRAELKRIAKDPSNTPEARLEAQQKLAKLPRNSSPVRLTTRCVVSGRPRAVYRKLGISRIALRELALTGMLPGIHKASW
jgi:small subunit ribosomal protein S14